MRVPPFNGRTKTSFSIFCYLGNTYVLTTVVGCRYSIVRNELTNSAAAHDAKCLDTRYKTSVHMRTSAHVCFSLIVPRSVCKTRYGPPPPVHRVRPTKAIVSPRSVHGGKSCHAFVGTRRRYENTSVVLFFSVSIGPDAVYDLCIRSSHSKQTKRNEKKAELTYKIDLSTEAAC